MDWIGPDLIPFFEPARILRIFGGVVCGLVHTKAVQSGIPSWTGPVVQIKALFLSLPEYLEY